jgi:hypothetical protein
MTDDEITKFFNDPDAVRNALQKGINNALMLHKKLGHPICVCENNKVMWIQPEDIVTPS